MLALIHCDPATYCAAFAQEYTDEPHALPPYPRGQLTSCWTVVSKEGGAPPSASRSEIRRLTTLPSIPPYYCAWTGYRSAEERRKALESSLRKTRAHTGTGN